MMLRMDLVAIPLWEYAGTIAILSLFAVLVVLVAGKIFNTTILMYGKRPTLPEIIRWLRA
jgi:ABC-2 type transport system permease protein